MKSKMKYSRILSVLLVLVLLIGILPMGALAGYDDADAYQSQEPEAQANDADASLQKFDLSQFDASEISKALLNKGISADNGLTKASDAGYSTEELSYVEAYAEEMVNPVGVVDVEGSADETAYVFVWLQSLPDALERVYAREHMNVRGYDRARANGRSARNSIRNLRSVNITDEYTEVFSGYALEATIADLENIAAMEGVFAITAMTYASMDAYTPDPNYETPGNAGAREVFDIAELHALGWDGTGVKVGVIDAGISRNHPDLADAYKGGWNYPANNANMDAPDLDHGTHVSGTIASQGIVSLGMAPGVDLYMAQVFNPAQHNQAAQNNITAALEDFSKGNANRGIPKVDIVNMSLGNAEATPYSADKVARNNAFIAGVLVVNSAGNEAYPAASPTLRNNYTLGSGGVSLPISVAASQYGGNPILTYVPTVISPNGDASFEFFCENGNSALADVFRDGSFGSLETRIVPYGPIAAADAVFAHPYQEYTIEPLNYVEGLGYELYYACPNNVPAPGTGSEMTTAEITALNNLPDGYLSGKILVVNRGQAFLEYKCQALRLGAGALIIINRDEAVIGNLNIGSETNAEDLLIFSAPYSVKKIMYDAVAGEKTVFLDPGDIEYRAHKLEPASFSSVGPVALTAELKPDIIAPGWAILSTALKQNLNASGAPVSPYAILDNTYTLMSGTSMSSPCVAGLAALVKQKYPGASPFEIKARLMNTADPFLLGNDSTNTRSEGSYYFNKNAKELSVFEQGAGFVDPYRAVLGSDIYITVDNAVPTGNTNQSTMISSMASFSFGQTAAGMVTKKLTAVVHGAEEYDVSVVYNNDTRYSRSCEGAVEAFFEINEDGSFDVWLEIGEDVSTDAYIGNLYEGFIVVTVGDEDFVLPWATRVGPAVPGGEWLAFPDRPIQATFNNANQNIAPQSSQNVIYYSFIGKGECDSVVLRRASSGLNYNYYLDFYLINAESNLPAYRYQILVGTQSILEVLLIGALKLSDVIVTDGSIYSLNIPAQAYAATNPAGTAFASSVSAIAAGSYNVALQFNKGSGNYYDFYKQAGITFSNTRPTITIDDVTLDANASTEHLYGYGTDTVSLEGQLYSAAIDTAADAGFCWCGLYLIYLDMMLSLDQSFNVLVDAASNIPLEFYDDDFDEYAPWFCDEDGYFSLTMPLQESGFFFPEDICSTGAVYCADAYETSSPWTVSGTTVTYGMAEFGCLASFEWTPLSVEDDPEIMVVSAALNNVAGTLTAEFLYQDGEVPEEIDLEKLDAVLFVEGEEDDVLVYEGYDAETGTATWSFEPYKNQSFTPIELLAVVTYTQYYITTSAEAEDISIHIVDAAAAASIAKLSGNKNNLTITITETYSDGSIEKYTETFSIDNNAIGTYAVNLYLVYVDTKGNDQIRACDITARP